MLNRLAKLALVSTSIAPICLTLWFVEISSKWNLEQSILLNLKNHYSAGLFYLCAALFLALIEQAIQLMVDRDIVDYYFDVKMQAIDER